MTPKKEYKNLLKGKKVAIVGPAKSLEGTARGSYIDSHDYVVRINYAKIKSTQDAGSRTDIIYYDGSHHDYSHCKPWILVCSYPETEWFYNSRCIHTVNYYKNIYDHYTVDSKLYNELKKDLSEKMNVRPNSGTIAIVDLLNSGVSKLYVTGIDFYRSSYLDTHPDYGSKSLEEINNIFKKGDNGDYHDTEAQFEYFKNLIKKEKRLEVDSFLKKII